MYKFLIMMSTAAALFGGAKQEASVDSVYAEEAVKAVKAFVEAGDSRDVATLQAVLHDEYRILAPNFQGQPLAIITKDTYISLIEGGQFGGVPRSITLKSVLATENTAFVNVKLESEQAVFNSYFTLVKIADEWQVVEDIPNATFK